MIIFNVNRNYYEAEKVNNTITIQELIDFLQEKIYYGESPDEKIVMAFDDGYTFGELTEEDIFSKEEYYHGYNSPYRYVKVEENY